MNKLTLNSLKERASEIATQELLAQIAGGVDNACHDSNNTYVLTKKRT